MYVYVYICVYIYLYAYTYNIYVYIHTYTYIYAEAQAMTLDSAMGKFTNLHQAVTLGHYNHSTWWVHLGYYCISFLIGMNFMNKEISPFQSTFAYQKRPITRQKSPTRVLTHIYTTNFMNKQISSFQSTFACHEPLHHNRAHQHLFTTYSLLLTLYYLLFTTYSLLHVRRRGLVERQHGGGGGGTAWIAQLYAAQNWRVLAYSYTSSIVE